MHKQCTLQKWIAGRLARIIFVDLKKYQPFGDSNIEYNIIFIDSATLPQLPWHFHYDLQQALSCKTSKLLRVSAPSAPNNGIGDGISEDVVGVQLSLKPPKFLHVKPQRFTIARFWCSEKGRWLAGQFLHWELVQPWINKPLPRLFNWGWLPFMYHIKWLFLALLPPQFS